MRVPLSWLREFAPVEGDPVALADTLSDLGMAVESMTRTGEGLDGIIVAKVLDLRPHPDADRVQLVDVDAGDGEPLQVVCGAFNMAVGDLVPLATIGTTMPNGMEIARRKMRGEWSNGMLCSGTELELTDDAGGILVLPEGLSLGRPLTEALGLAADVVYELEINANRPDAMSVIGVARDVAARLGVPFSMPAPALEESGTPAGELASVEIAAPEACGRFVARVLRDVAIGPSPAWLASRLTLAGMRPISNVVDVSNYVMLELGQPNHAYDLDRLGGRGIRVRRARHGETMVTLDEVERTFIVDDLLICDAEDRPVGIAGIMGGADTEISDATRQVLLELAWFDPMTIARTSKRLGLRSEASARFERGCDWNVIDLAAARFCELLAESSVVHPGSIDERGELPDRSPIRVRTARVNAILGTSLGDADVKRHLDPIGFTATPAGDGVHDVSLPSWRFDSALEIDVIEEVARHHGYSNIEPTVPKPLQIGHLTAYQRARRRLRDVLAGVGLSEAMPMPFLAPDDLARVGLPEGIRIANPLDASQSVLRTSLLPGLLHAVAYNESHRNLGVRLFEVGHVYGQPPPGAEPPLPDEREVLGVVLAGADAREAKEVWDLVAGAMDLVGFSLVADDALAGLHPTRTARIVLEGETVGAVGEVDPGVLESWGITQRVGWVGLDLERALGSVEEPVYRQVSRYPSGDIDLAFVVDDGIAAATVESTLREAAGELLSSLRLFDVFRGGQLGDGRRSLAFSLRLQAPDRTLTDDDIAEVRRRAIDAVESLHGASLRG